MKFKALLYMASAAAALSLAACNGEIDPYLGRPFIYVNGESAVEVTESSAAHEFAVSVKSNREWMIEGEDMLPDWLSVNIDGVQPANSKGVQITFTLLSNIADDAFDRSHIVIFSNGTQDASLKIIQQGAKGSAENIFEESFSSSLGTFTPDNEKVGETPIWSFDSKYSCAKATAYIGGNNNAAVSRLISPEIDLTGVTEAYLYFDHAGNYFTNIPKAKEECVLEISEDGGENWTAIEIPNFFSNFTFVNSGAIDLASYAGKKVKIAFKYSSTLEKAGTWEIKNVVVGRVAPVEPEVPEYATIAEAIAQGDGKEVVLSSVTVAEVATNSYLVTDGTSYLLIYLNAAHEYVVGDNVKVKGTVATYNNAKQLTAPVTEKLSNGEYTHPEATDITADFDNYAGTAVSFVSVTGKLTKSGNYYNFTVEGASTKTGSVVYPKEALDIDNKLGMPVVISGYFLYFTSSGKYVNIMASSIETAGDYFVVSPKEISLASDKTSASFEISTNLDWTAEALTEGYTLDKSEGNGNATVTVTFEANMDTENEKTGSIKVTSAAGEETVVITQAKYIETTGASFVKVTAEPEDWSGTYLIVYEDGNIAFDASLAIDNNGAGAKGAGFEVTIAEGGVIAANADNILKTVEIAPMEGGYSILAASGTYLKGTSGSNGLFNSSDPELNVLVFGDGGTVDIWNSKQDMCLRCNTNNGPFLRYYKKTTIEGSTGSNYKKLALYKLTEAEEE